MATIFMEPIRVLAILFSFEPLHKVDTWPQQQHHHKYFPFKYIYKLLDSCKLYSKLF